jgi:hypothetical protein
MRGEGELLKKLLPLPASLIPAKPYKRRKKI